jgi:lipoprotein-releasing system ATP-binding protein
MSDVVLGLRDLKRSFVQGGVTIEVLKGITLEAAAGEIIGLLGQSGAGKSTLLQAAGLLEGGFEGEITILGKPCSRLSSSARAEMRLQHLGFVYQFHHLLPDFTACENVMMPQLILGRGKKEARSRALDLLGKLGLGSRADHKPAQLSGGEQQRVAVARAMANEPDLLLADEPTGNLDEATGNAVLETFIDMVRSRGAAALIATHNLALARRMDRIIMLRDGRIAEEASGAGIALLQS